MFMVYIYIRIIITSAHPFSYLHLYKNSGIKACGTCVPIEKVSQRNWLPKLPSKTIGYDYRSNGPLVASAWVDKCTIYFLITLHVGELPSGRTCVVKRKQLDGTFVDLACPPCLPDYQPYMRGVDRGNVITM